MLTQNLVRAVVRIKPFPLILPTRTHGIFITPSFRSKGPLFGLIQEEGKELEVSYDTIRIIGVMTNWNSVTGSLACGGPGLVKKIEEARQQTTPAITTSPPTTGQLTTPPPNRKAYGCCISSEEGKPCPSGLMECDRNIGYVNGQWIQVCCVTFGTTSNLFDLPACHGMEGIAKSEGNTVTTVCQAATSVDPVSTPPAVDTADGIIGTDDRVKIAIKTEPLHSVGIVVTDYGACTGVMVGRDLMLTAQSCLNKTADGTIHQMLFAPAYLEGDVPHAPATAIEYFYDHDVSDSAPFSALDFAFDYMIVKLDRPVGDEVGYWETILCTAFFSASYFLILHIHSQVLTHCSV